MDDSQCIYASTIAQWSCSDGYQSTYQESMCAYCSTRRPFNTIRPHFMQSRNRLSESLVDVLAFLQCGGRKIDAALYRAYAAVLATYRDRLHRESSSCRITAHAPSADQHPAMPHLEGLDYEKEFVLELCCCAAYRKNLLANVIITTG